MGEIHTHIPVKLFTAISFGKGIAVSFLIDKVVSCFGQIDSSSDEFIVDNFTPYYQKEMGKNVTKKIISFSKLIQPDMLPQIKIATNKLEGELLDDGKRTVNIDPGYLTQAKMVLATTKDYSHRLYMAQGVFADLHLIWSANSYHPQPWTYPDYTQKLSIDYFNSLRKIYLENLSGKQDKKDNR